MYFPNKDINIYYILTNKLLRNINEIKCVCFFFQSKKLFHCSENIFTPLSENKSRIYRKKLEYPLCMTLYIIIFHIPSNRVHKFVLSVCL